MKYYESHFCDYLEKSKKCKLHKKYGEYYDKFPESIDNLKNIILYGPTGVGKYTQMLESIKKYSGSNLKYEKKICIIFQKINYYFMVSDIHVEIDFSLLGCNSKLLWNDIYNQLINISVSNNNKICIIVCKNFHDIHNELLENFYSYMQKPLFQKIEFKYILLTEHISFIPNNIINICERIHIPRPSKSSYVKVCKYLKNTDTDNITNIKHGYDNLHNLQSSHVIICDIIIEKMCSKEQINYLKFRDNLYDIFIYQLNIYDCIWYILKSLITDKKISENKLPDIFLHMYLFFQYYNNNYRPIYHLEYFIFYLIDIID